MQLLGKRSLAWVLKWITTLVILFWAAILLWVLPLAVMNGFRSSHVVHDFPIAYHWTYPGPPTEIIQPISSDKEVIELEVRLAAITFRTLGSVQGTILALFGLILWIGLVIWILWILRKILVSLVAGQPLIEANARRFRGIGILIVCLAVQTSLFRTLGHFYLQSHFELPPSPGLMSLIQTTLPMGQLFLGLLILLMAEVMRIGAEHRLDSEAVV